MMQLDFTSLELPFLGQYRLIPSEADADGTMCKNCYSLSPDPAASQPFLSCYKVIDIILRQGVP
jgi:hypothetical protein